MKYFTTFILILYISTLAHSQDINDNVRYIPESEVPTTVKESQSTYFPTNFITEWQVQEVNGMDNAQNLRYISKFEDGSKQGFSASYLPTGLLIFNSEFMLSEIIPAGIRLKIAEEYENFEIQYADFITFYKPKRQIYMVKLLRNTDVIYVYYNTAGIKIPETSLPPELVVLME